MAQVEEFPGSWYFRKTEEDGIFVKSKGERITSKGALMESIVNLKPASKNKGRDYAGKVEVSFTGRL